MIFLTFFLFICKVAQADQGWLKLHNKRNSFKMVTQRLAFSSQLIHVSHFVCSFYFQNLIKKTKNLLIPLLTPEKRKWLFKCVCSKDIQPC